MTSISADDQRYNKRGAWTLTMLEKSRPRSDTSWCGSTVNHIFGVFSVVTERDSSIEAALEMPPVLLHQLVLLRGQEFANIVRVQAPCFLYRWSSSEIDVIDQDFQELQSSYNSESYF